MGRSSASNSRSDCDNADNDVRGGDPSESVDRFIFEGIRKL